jgi:hypothetical protein
MHGSRTFVPLQDQACCADRLLQAQVLTVASVFLHHAVLQAF